MRPPNYPRRLRHASVALALALVVPACKDKAAPESEPAPKRKWEYSAEDFGIGRPHTANAACNGEIDRLLEEVRVCYNSRPDTECVALQQSHSERITQLKNTRRCRR